MCVLKLFLGSENRQNARKQTAQFRNPYLLGAKWQLWIVLSTPRVMHKELSFRRQNRFLFNSNFIRVFLSFYLRYQLHQKTKKHIISNIDFFIESLSKTTLHCFSVKVFFNYHGFSIFIRSVCWPSNYCGRLAPF